MSIFSRPLPFALVIMISLSALSGCKKHEAEVASDLHEYESKEVKETDPVMIKYQDQLKRIFGDLELDLIRRYRKQQNEVKTSEDFYHLMSRLEALIDALEKDLIAFSQEKKQKGEELPDMSWFKEVAEGMEVEMLHGDSYRVFLNQEKLKSHAARTQGDADDHYIELLQMVFPDHSRFPVWLRLDDIKYAACSKLGEGNHFEILEKMNEALLADDMFRNDIEQLHSRLMHDVLDQTNYCNTKRQVLAEMNNILAEAHINRDEKPRLRDRIAAIQAGEIEGIQFDCNSGNCEYAY